MNKVALSAMLILGAHSVSACSTRPRNFTAELAAPVTDRATFENDFRTCQTMVRQGRKSGFKDAAAMGLATGLGAVGGGAALASAGLVGVNIGTGAVSAMTYAVPFIGVFAGFGVSRAIRSGREGKVKRAMDSCLNEYGYGVSRWSPVKKKEDAAKIAAAKASIQPSEPMVPAMPVSSVAGVPGMDSVNLEPASTPGPDI
jgi:hypothetical protein